MNGYTVYGDNSANPSKDSCCRIGNTFSSKEEAFEYAKYTGYRYVEVTDPSGRVIEEPAPVNFLLFAGRNYYPAGGYNDLHSTATSEDELREIIAENKRLDHYSAGRFEWWQIVNANTHVIVDSGNVDD